MLNTANIAKIERNTSPHLSLGEDEVSALCLREMRALYDVTKALADITLAFGCQPRFNTDNDYNAAGQIMERMTSFFCGLEDLIGDIASKTECNSPDDVQTKFGIQIERGVGDSFADLSVVCAQAALAEKRSQHKQRTDREKRA